MAGNRLLYAFFDGDVMVYVGQTNSLAIRLWMHRKDATVKRTAICRLMQRREAEGLPLRFQTLAILPPDRQFACEVERDLIAKVGLVEDGGTLLNGRRSSVRGDKAGYSRDARNRIADVARKCWADPAYRREQVAKSVARNQSPEGRANSSKTSLARWSDPEFRDRMTAQRNSPEAIERSRERFRLLWADPVFREKMAKRRPRPKSSYKRKGD